ncbi:MAG TPA: type III pantothenate kinase [Longimicrobium sp.]|nr:type III pantothenate kinase [Longimicrobium sp.]
MDIVIDVGHTETGVGWFEGAELRGSWRLATDPRRTADDYGLALRQMLGIVGVSHTDVRSATIGSVVPAVTRVLEAACRRYVDTPPNEVSALVPLPLRLEVDDPLALSPSRLANAAAAHRLYRRRDVVVVDLGASTTYDCVTRDGAFVGGVIAPGLRSAASTLPEWTGRFPDGGLAPPGRVIGHRVEESVRSGVFFGAVDAVEGMLGRIREAWGKADALVVATGGLAEALAPHCRAVAVIEPHLTLHGLKAIHDHHARAARRR